MKAFFSRKPQQRSPAATAPSPVLSPALRVPPVPQLPHRHILVSTSKNGLTVRPRDGGSRTGFRVGWGRDGVVEELREADKVEGGVSCGALGIAGLLRLYERSFLLIITKADHIGDFFDASRPVLKVAGVTAIPLEPSQAQATIEKLASKTDGESSDSDSASDDESDAGCAGDVKTPARERAEPVLGAEEGEAPTDPLAGSGLAHPAPEAQLSTEPSRQSDSDAPAEGAGASAEHAPPVDNHEELEAKIVNETTRLLTFTYFATSFDITTSLQRKHKLAAASGTPSTPNTDAAFVEPSAFLPLWRRVDRRFWWSAELQKPFVDAGLHTFIIPLMQGFFSISSFNLPASSMPTPTSDAAPRPPVDSSELENVHVDFILVSRRSRDRSGLRYQRRGADTDGKVANFCETEMTVRLRRAGRFHTFSFLQIRGSIPLFWSQSPYSLKPAPVLDRTPEESKAALNKHFDQVTSIYGKTTAINLAELTGKEAAVSKGYEDNAKGVKDLTYLNFDFHHECRGMKYENLSKLLDQLGPDFQRQGFFWQNGQDSTMAEQNGVFRTNCIDCLDRTNVVQSAIARHVLGHQLSSVGLHSHFEAGKTEAELVFNDVWANNGDAISTIYAGTSALKGDFTRTGKRDWQGMLNDARNSISRMYRSVTIDFFTQACIDYALGNRDLSIFAEFVEKLQSTDPGEIHRLAQIRASAIENSAQLVISEGESRRAAWTLLSPVESNTRFSDKFEEKVLILTEKAVYAVSYDYQLSKPIAFTRILLGDIVGLQSGAYILSPLQEASRDTNDNYGFILRYETSDETSTRATTYTFRNAPSSSSPSRRSGRRKKPEQQEEEVELGNAAQPIETKGVGAIPPGQTQFVAFKALPRHLLLHLRGASTPERADEGEEDGEGEARTSKEAVEHLVGRLQTECARIGNILDDGVQHEPVISLAEAQKTTSIFARIEYAAKRFLFL